jgi:hypothetical protein
LHGSIPITKDTTAYTEYGGAKGALSIGMVMKGSSTALNIKYSKFNPTFPPSIFTIL